mmetsp:Transcript_611/g.1046  ORF Transcript_611/g.1046 Transcript_611/m.1046 type:complete len:101 (+) Transcript_611:1640-1942(+)
MADSPQYYQGFESSVLWVPSIAAFDPWFISPVVFGVGNYLFLKHYQHPLSIHLSPTFKLLLGFSSSLLCVLWPVVYFDAWGSFWLTHLLLHKLSFRYRSI